MATIETKLLANPTDPTARQRALYAVLAAEGADAVQLATDFGRWGDDTLHAATLPAWRGVAEGRSGGAIFARWREGCAWLKASCQHSPNERLASPAGD